MSSTLESGLNTSSVVLGNDAYTPSESNCDCIVYYVGWAVGWYTNPL